MEQFLTGRDAERLQSLSEHMVQIGLPRYHYRLEDASSQGVVAVVHFYDFYSIDFEKIIFFFK